MSTRCACVCMRVCIGIAVTRTISTFPTNVANFSDFPIPRYGETRRSSLSASPDTFSSDFSRPFLDVKNARARARHDDFSTKIKRIRNVGIRLDTVQRNDLNLEVNSVIERKRREEEFLPRYVGKILTVFQIGTKIQTKQSFATVRREFETRGVIKDPCKRRSGFYSEIFFHTILLSPFSLFLCHSLRTIWIIYRVYFFLWLHGLSFPSLADSVTRAVCSK